MINKVISVCKLRDVQTFKICAQWLPDFVKAKKYLVIVPEQELSDFQHCGIKNFEFISELKYNNIKQYLEEKLGHRHKRIGWYLQQFIKLSEIDEGSDDDLNLIWDADTIPLKRLSFEKYGKIYFYQGIEYHKPYFELTKNVLGLDKIARSSFIAQCFPSKVSWIKNFKKYIESKNNNKIWYQAIIDRIDDKQKSGFSEYETLGTFILEKYPSKIKLRENSWTRDGNALIGNVKNLEHNYKWLSKRYDFITFEHWQKQKMTWRRYIKIHLSTFYNRIFG